jgi:hypothetical protein
VPLQEELAMTDNRFVMTHNPHVDPHTRYVLRDGGLEAARTVYLMAMLGIASRLFFIYACAHRISVARTVLGLPEANGKLDLTGRSDAADLVTRARDADSMVTLAVWVTVIVLILYLLAWVSLARRTKRGDPLPAAVNHNRAIRIAGRIYILTGLVSTIARKAFTPGPDPSPTDQVRAAMHGDTATIGLQMAVIASLLLVALATRRELDKAYSVGRIG